MRLMSSSRSRPAVLRPLCAALLAALSGLSQASSNGLVISQVYGGGGNSGATLRNDFVELFNAGTAPVSLAGWSVQYASATGSTWQVTPLTAVTLQPGQYYLVQQAAGTGGTASLPTPDATGNVAMAGGSGKVALVNQSTALSGATPSGTQLVDLVGYGSAGAFEGSGATPALTNTTAALRAQNGCTDTNNNSADFSAAVPTPRNTASPVATCGTGTPTPPPATLTPISQIQGSGSRSPLEGRQVITEGVVTKLLNNGFFIQSRTPDNDPTTSEGILVFTSTTPTVAVGDEVQVAATVTEFNVGAATNALTAAHTVTELTSVTALTTLSRGNTVVPTPITFPELNEDDLEQVEGMLVRIDTPLTASQNYFLGRYGQITLAAGGRLVKPTQLYPAGSSAAVTLADDNARRRIILDDGTSRQNPSPTPYLAEDQTQRSGDTLPGITGVIDYGLVTASNTGLADYKLHPTAPVVFTRANPRQATPSTVGGTHRVASFNVLNYFNGDGLGGGFPTARGASTPTEFQRQRTKIIAALQQLDADVVGLMEIENDGEGAQSALADLVNGLNAAYGRTAYALVPAPTTAGATGTDAIKVAMIYKPANLSLAGAARTDTSAIHNRPPMAQTFAAANGEKFTVVVNHFKSKGCDATSDPADFDQGDGQGCYNARRRLQAEALHTFVQGIQSAQADQDVLLIGDFNAYAKEDPVLDLQAFGYTDMAEVFEGGQHYSYVFDGEAGSLDHALASHGLRTQISGTRHWHINADEPSILDYNQEFKDGASTCPPTVPTASCSPDYYTATPFRSSDHDPVLVGLSLYRTLTGTAQGDVITGTAGDDRIIGGSGADVITTGQGRDVLVYTSLRDGIDRVTDFTPGSDRIDLSAITAALGGPNALSTGHVRLVDTAQGVQIRIDTDGFAGPANPVPLVTLNGLTAAHIVASRDLLL